MHKLDIWHHKLIVLLIILLIFITGVLFGVRVRGATEGTPGMEIIVFAMLLVNLALSYIIFTQVIHLRDDVEFKRPRK